MRTKELLTMKNILVTGGAGFIGSHIVEYLVEHGHSVTVIDNLFSGSVNNLSEVIKKIEFIEGDIRDKDLLFKHCKSTGGIIHLAAISSVPMSVENPLTCNEVNIDSTLNLLQIAKECNVKKVVFASSSAVYGNPAKEVLVTESDKTAPLTPYAISKYTGELYCQTYSEIYNLQTIALRLFNVYGPRQNPDSEYSAVIAKFINALNSDKQPSIYGDGYQTRDFIYIKDVVSAFALALKTDQTGVYNIASGHSYSVNELFEILTKVLGKTIEANYFEPRIGEVKYSQASISLAQSKLKFQPAFTLEQGLKDKLDKMNIVVNA